MRTKPAIILAACIMLHARGAFASERPLVVSWRILPDSCKYAFACVATNTSEIAVELLGVTRFLEDSHSVGIGALDDPRRIIHELGAISSPVDDLHDVSVLGPGEAYHYSVPKEFLVYGSSVVGHYVKAYWFYGRVYSNPLTFGFLNGSKETVTVGKPLTQASRIIASAPGIEYKRELFVAGQPSDNIEIEAGKVGEWRIPWQQVYDLISESDLAKIVDAGGDLDLVWKVGEYVSAPLPITLGTVDVE